MKNLHDSVAYRSTFSSNNLKHLDILFLYDFIGLSYLIGWSNLGPLSFITSLQLVCSVLSVRTGSNSWLNVN